MKRRNNSDTAQSSDLNSQKNLTGNSKLVWKYKMGQVKGSERSVQGENKKVVV